MKKIITLILVTFCLTSVAQQYRPVEQAQDFKKPVRFSTGDVRFIALTNGTGSCIGVTAEGMLVKVPCSGGGQITINQVVGLQTALNNKQGLLTAGNLIEISGDTIRVIELGVANIVGLDDSLNLKQNVIQAGEGLSWNGDTLFVDSVIFSAILGLQDSLNLKQNVLVAGNGITISGDTISTASGALVKIENGRLYPISDTLGLGAYAPSYFSTISDNSTLTLQNNGTGSALRVIGVIDINGVNISGVDTIYNSNILNKTTLLTHYGIKEEMEKKIEGVNNISGGGTALFTGISNKKANIRRIRAEAGSGITVGINNNEVQIGFNSALAGDTIVNLGNGDTLAVGKSGDSLLIKSLIAGSNITLTPTDTTIVIASSGGGGSGQAANVGGEAEVFKELSADTLRFRTLVGVSPISVTQDTNRLLISFTGGDPVVTGAVNQSIAGIKTFNNAVVTEGGITHAGTLPISATGSNSITINTNSTERLRIDGSGRFLYGTTTPVTNSNITLITSPPWLTIGDSSTDAVSKTGGIATPHRTNTEEPLAVIYGNVTTTEGIVNIGGGSAAQNAATSVRFYNTANNTTPTGTEVARFTGGMLGINTTAPLYKLEVNGDAWVRDTLRIGTIANSFKIPPTAGTVGHVLKLNSDSVATWQPDNNTTYSAGAGLNLLSTQFNVNGSGNTILARNTTGTGNYSEVSIGSSQLLGRGSTGNIAPITLGNNISMTGTTINVATFPEIKPESRSYYNFEVNPDITQNTTRVAVAPLDGDSAQLVDLVSGECYFIEGKITIGVSNIELGTSDVEQFYDVSVMLSGSSLSLWDVVETPVTLSTSLSRQTASQQVWYNTEDPPKFERKEGVVYYTIPTTPVKVCPTTSGLYPYLLIRPNNISNAVVATRAATMRVTLVSDFDPQLEMPSVE